MFANNLKLDGIENILEDIGYMEEMKGAGEDQEHKYKKSGKKSKDYDGDGTVEDESDEYAGVKDRAIKKAMGKCSKCGKEPCECEDTKKESVDFSTVLDELTDEEVLFLSDTLIEEVVEEFFYETLEEGFEIDELETILIEQLETELTYLEEAKVTVGHDSNSEVSRPSRLAKVKDAVKKVASGAKKVAKKVAGAAGEVAGSAVAGYKKASAAAKDAPGGKERDDSTKDSPKTGTKRPGILGRIASGLKSGLKKAIRGAGKVAGKVVKTAKAGYDEGRGKETKSAPVAAKPAATPAAKPAAKKPAAKPATPTTTKTATAKKKAGGNLDNLLKQIRSEAKMSAKEEMELDEADSLAAMQARREKRQKANMKKHGTPGFDYSKPPSDKKGYLDAITKKEEYVDEAGKLQGGGNDPCWKGYEMVGMKNKGGKEVPNCVPKEEYEELVMDMIQEGYDMDQVREIIGALEDGYEVIFEENGAVINDEVEQLDEEVLDEQFLSDVEAVADWLHTEGIIENEDEFFELMEDLDEDEIEELYTIVKEELKPLPKEKMARQSKKAYGKEVRAAAAGDEKETNKQMQRRIAMQNPGGRRTALEKKKKLNTGYEMIGNSLEEGGLEVRNYSWREVMESQAARNNPEKYEADKKKKYAPVRGEKTPMPPRGDKRREDFEKWYAANVR